MPPFLHNGLLFSGSKMVKLRQLIFSGFISVSLLSTPSYADSSEDFERALQAYNEKNYNESFIHLKNSLKQDPDNLASKILMGKLLLINGYLIAAELEFLEALDQGADIELIAEPLGNTWLFLNKYHDIIEFDESERLSGDSKIKWLQIKASACVRSNDYQCAKQAYQDSLKINPNHVRSIDGLTSIALFENKRDEAANYIKQSESINPNNPLMLRQKGQLARVNGEIERAEQFYNQSITLNPSDPQTLRRLLDLYVETNDFEKAQSLIDKIIEQTPNDPLVILLNNWLDSRNYQSRIDNEQLNKLDEIISAITPEDIAAQPVLQYIKGLSEFFKGNMEQATLSLAQYVAKRPNDMQAVMLLARAYMSSQKAKQALALLEDHQEQLLENINSALMLGELFLKDGKTFKAESLAFRLNRLYPNNSRLSLFNVKLLSARGKLEEANQILDASYDANQMVPEFLLTYTLVKLNAQQFSTALDSATKLLALYPEEPEFINLKAGILIKMRRYDEAREAVDAALAINPDLFAAKFNLAMIETRTGNYTRSNNILNRLLEIADKHQDSMLLKADNLTALGEDEEALDIYNTILTLDPQNQRARQRMLQRALANNDLETAIYHLNRLLRDDFDNPNYLMTKVDIYITQGKLSEAQEVVDIIQHVVAESPVGLLRLSQIEARLNKPNAALATLDKALALAPNNVQLKLEKAKMLLENDQPVPAKTLLNSIAEGQEQNANYWFVRGLLADAEGQFDQAVAHFDQSVALDNRFNRALILLQDHAINGYGEATFESRALSIIEKNESPLTAKRLLALFYYVKQDNQKARALYDELLLDPTVQDKAEIYEKLALLYMEVDLDKSLAYVQEAFKLAGNSTSVLDTYGWVLTEKGDYQAGLAMLRRANATDADNPTVLYHIGYTLVKLDRKDEAKKTLTTAVNMQRPFYYREKARALLETL